MMQLYSMLIGAKRSSMTRSGWEERFEVSYCIAEDDDGARRHGLYESERAWSPAEGWTDHYTRAFYIPTKRICEGLGLFSTMDIELFLKKHKDPSAV
jgi:hypothetical protein